ncbi:DUF2986 domain-containing protein [Marinobacterium sedimentorum]|uniref:DUF2986 domain-containing protein n=1 Tax=Marinobacterium sedimentorum TaxID=2927804 RepID=UPI0020C72EDE|nr:DUF2986 domain-containing protein [Marinobacterium sedimentorum]MCP8688112.1 DUF2986 domain-containing protein [Marinobacterium sedimentorum]
MNRRKKINQILGKKAKKANLKANPSHKPRYISKAEREKAQETESAELGEVSQDAAAENGGAEEAGAQEGTVKDAGAEG